MFKIINQSKISGHELKFKYLPCFINAYGIYKDVSFTIRCTFFFFDHRMFNQNVITRSSGKITYFSLMYAKLLHSFSLLKLRPSTIDYKLTFIFLVQCQHYKILSTSDGYNPSPSNFFFFFFFNNLSHLDVSYYMKELQL